jgi:hypothetical protein
MDVDTKSLDQNIRQKAAIEYNDRVNAALDNLYKVLSNSGNPGWIDYRVRDAVKAAIIETQNHFCKQVQQDAVKKFLEAYENLIHEFPNLQQDSYDSGTYDGEA